MFFPSLYFYHMALLVKLMSDLIVIKAVLLVDGPASKSFEKHSHLA